MFGKLDEYLRAKDCDGSYEREFRVREFPCSRNRIRFISMDDDGIARYVGE